MFAAEEAAEAEVHVESAGADIDADRSSAHCDVSADVAGACIDADARAHVSTCNAGTDADIHCASGNINGCGSRDTSTHGARIRSDVGTCGDRAGTEIDSG